MGTYHPVWFIYELEVWIWFWSPASWPPTSCAWAFPVCSLVLYKDWNDTTIFAYQKGLIEDLPYLSWYLETFLNDHRQEIWSSDFGSSLTSCSIVSYIGTNSDGVTNTFKCKKKIMRLEIKFLVFNHQKNYQSRTPLLLWIWPVTGRLTLRGTVWVCSSIIWQNNSLLKFRFLKHVIWSKVLIYIPKYLAILLDALKLERYVITNENKRRPILHCIKAVRFSHGFHGVIQSFTGTSTMD